MSALFPDFKTDEKCKMTAASMLRSSNRLVNVANHSAASRGARSSPRWFPPNAGSQRESISTRMIETRKPTTILSREIFCLALSLLVNYGVADAQAKAQHRNPRPTEDPSGQAMLGF